MALRDARNTIKTMPANFLTLPGSTEKVFPCSSKKVNISGEISVDIPFLSAFGEFQVPTHIWDAMTHFACWIEPAINNEWCLLMQKYHLKNGQPVNYGDLHNALIWKDDLRSTSQIRKIVEAMKLTDHVPECVWTGDSLSRKQYEIDHCFPYANWFNNDLWNLLPATKAANQKKSDKLPAGALLLDSRNRILDWWQSAFKDSVLESQFYTEATASLPGVQSRSIESVFEGLTQQRLHLKHEQQMPEWYGIK